MSKDYYVYIMTNKANRILYTGVTNNLARRTQEHNEGNRPGFTAKYNVKKLVYFERYGEVQDAIAREKQIKGGSRKKKMALIDTQNPTWQDLSIDLHEHG